MSLFCLLSLNHNFGLDQRTHHGSGISVTCSRLQISLRNCHGGEYKWQSGFVWRGVFVHEANILIPVSYLMPFPSSPWNNPSFVSRNILDFFLAYLNGVNVVMTGFPVSCLRSCFLSGVREAFPNMSAYSCLLGKWHSLRVQEWRWRDTQRGTKVQTKCGCTVFTEKGKLVQWNFGRIIVME